MIQSEELLKRRGDISMKLQVALGIFLFALGCACDFNRSWIENLSSFSMRLVWFMDVGILAELLKRLTLIAEESRHLASRYQNSFKKLLTKIFWFNRLSCALFLITFAGHMLVLFPSHSCGTGCVPSFPLICSILLVHLFADFANIKKSPVSDSIYLDSLERLDYGSGMAQSFFHGYLRICLPDDGNGKGIRERIDDYISKEKLCPDSFPVKKLFILIPSSTYLPNDLKEASDNWMLHQGPLEKQIKNRAGVIERSYKNSVYKIKDPKGDNDGFYAVVEGATPCKTFYEVTQFSGSRKGLYMENQHDIVFRFYDTLIETLNDPANENCKNLCEFIYYNDKDEHGEPVNVAHILQERVEEIRKKERQRRLRWQIPGLETYGE